MNQAPDLPQIVYHEPTEYKENNYPAPENPLILSRPPLHHAYRISAHPKCIRYTIQLFLRPFEHLPLLA